MAMSKGRFALAVVSLAVGIAALGDSQAQAPGSANACIATVPPSGKLCTDVESCKKFCTCACNFDPSKWIIFSLSKVGLTRNLMRAPQEAVDQALVDNR